MAIIFRMILLLAPLVLLIVWLRWRGKRGAAEEIRDRELARAKKTLLILILVVLGAGMGLRYTDTNSATTDTIYVPAHMQDGKLIPGYFAPAAEAPVKGEAPATENAPAAATPEMGVETDNSNENPS